MSHPATFASSSTAVPYLAPGPEVLRLQELPSRIQQMVRLLLQHQETIVLYNIMSVELHCHRDEKRDAIKIKMALHP